MLFINSTANIPAKSIEMTKIESISITGAFNRGDDDRAMTYNVAENVWSLAPAAFVCRQKNFLDSAE